MSAVARLITLILEMIRDMLTTRKAEAPAKEVVDNVQDFREALAKNDGVGIDALGADQHDRVQQALRGDKG